MKISGKIQALIWVAIAASTFAASVLFLKISPARQLTGDEPEYYALAANVAAGNGFSVDGRTPSVFRPPVFAVMLGAWFRLGGGPSLPSAFLFQALVHSLACATAFLLFMEIFGALRLSLFLTFWLALLPPHLARLTHVLQEPVITFFTTLSVLLSLKALRLASSGAAVGAGVSWGLCTLAKFPAFIGPFLLALKGVRNGRQSPSLKQALLLLVFFLLTLVPWAARNYRHFHRVIVVNSMGKCMLEGVVTSPYKQSLFVDDADTRAGELLVEDLNAKGISGSEENKILFRFMKRNPAYYFFGRPVSGSVYFTFPDFYTNWYTGALAPAERFRKVTAYAWWLLLTLPLYLLLFYRAAQLVRGRLSSPLDFIVVFFLLYWAQYAVLWNDPRYSVPVYPLLLCLLPAGVKRVLGDKDEESAR
jgi:4-amino-4-deoxy-L-arabinose transferase-like glycosyltransferase